MHEEVNMHKKMHTAINQALKAKEKNEVPVGSAIYLGDELIALSHNTCEEKNDPTAHAEMNAIKEAASKIGKENLKKCTLYVTLEPCPMCAGAIINCGLKSVVFGAYDNDFGAYDGYVNLFSHSYAKNIDVYGGICENECSKIIKDFFAELRNK